MVTFQNQKPKYKAHLVAKTLNQEEGIDFDEIFLLVLNTMTLRTKLALVAKRDLDSVQMELKTTFLHGNLHDHIYMQ